MSDNDTHLKRCPLCPEGEEWHPATPEFFQRDKYNKDGFVPRCKSCDKKRRKERRSDPEWRSRNLAYQQAYKKAHYSKEGDRSDVRERILAKQREYALRPEIHEKLIAYHRAHNKTHERILQRRAYGSRPEVKQRIKDYQKDYYTRPGKQERKLAYFRAYNRTAKRREQTQVYRARPEVRQQRLARIKEYSRRSEVQERKRIYGKEYRSRPEVQERKRVQNAHRKIRQKSALGTYTLAQIQELLKRQHYRCYYAACGFSKFQKTKGKYIFHVDHTFPLSRADKEAPINDISYLVLACPTCNMQKHNKYPHEFFEGGRLL